MPIRRSDPDFSAPGRAYCRDADESRPMTRFARSAATETWRRVGFTIGALLLYRLGAHIPLPGIDLSVLALLELEPSRGTWREWLDIGLSSYQSRFSIFALGLTPYVLVWLLAELAIGLVPA